MNHNKQWHAYTVGTMYHNNNNNNNVSQNKRLIELIFRHHQFELLCSSVADGKTNLRQASHIAYR